MMLTILLVIFFFICLILILLPYSIGITLDKGGKDTLYSIYVRSLYNFLRIEWIKRYGQQYIQFQFMKLTIQKRIDRLDKSREREIDDRLISQEKSMKKRSNKLCTIAYAIVDFPKLAMQFFDFLHLEVLNIQYHFGTNDPASTGIVYGLIQSLDPLCCNRVYVSVIPYFHEKKCEGSIVIICRFLFFRFLWWLIHTTVHFLLNLRRCHFKLKGNLAW